MLSLATQGSRVRKPYSGGRSAVKQIDQVRPSDGTTAEPPVFLLLGRKRTSPGAICEPTSKSPRSVARVPRYSRVK